MSGISDLSPVVVFTGDGTRGPFPFTDGGVSIPYAASTHLYVERISSVGAQEPLTAVTDYTLSETLDDSTGLYSMTITLTAGQSVLSAASGSTPAERLVVWREAPLDQSFALEFNQRFPSQSFTRLQNKMVLGLQDLRAMIGRAPLMPAGETADLPDKLARKGLVLAGHPTTGALTMMSLASMADADGLVLVQEQEFEAIAAQVDFTLADVQVIDPSLLLVWVGGAIQPSSTYSLALSGADTILTLGSAPGAGVDVVVRVLGSMGTTDVGVSPAMTAVVQAATIALGRDALESVVTPTQITSNQNDYSPTGLSTASVLRLSSDDERAITGIEAQPAGRRLMIRNVGLYALTFHDESSSSTAANRFSFPYDRALTVAPGESMELMYDGTLSRWTGGGFFSPIHVIDRSAAGGWGLYKYALGKNGDTSYPDLALDQGNSQPTLQTGNIAMNTPGDGVDLYTYVANGTPTSPSVRSGSYAALAMYVWPIDSSLSPVPSGAPYSGITYLGRAAQLRLCTAGTPTSSSRPGAMVWGTTNDGDLTPWDDGWISKLGNMIIAPGLVEDNTSLPWDPSGADTTNAFNPVSGANWSNFHGDASLTILARDLGDAGALAFLNNTSRTNGHVTKYEQSSNELWGYRRVSGVDSTLWRLGFSAGFVDLGFSGTTSPATRSQAISGQVDRIEFRGGDGSQHPQILVDGATANANLRLKARGSAYVVVDEFPLQLYSSVDSAAQGPTAELYRYRASPAANDVIGAHEFYGSDSGGNKTLYAAIAARIEDPTDSSEDGRLRFGVMTAGTFAYELGLIGAALHPTTDDGLALGTAAFKWSDAFFASGAVVDWDNGDVTLTHSANALAFAGATSGYSFDRLLNLSGANAGQIQFPATQNASADANTLDDYEEGTWTPSLTFDTAGDLSVAFSTQSARYTKIGNIVCVTCALVTSSFTHTTASGDLRITGLPFAAGIDTAAGIGRLRGVTKASYTHFGVRIDASANYAIILASGSAVAPSSVTASNMPTGGTVHIQFSMTYSV